MRAEVDRGACFRVWITEHPADWRPARWDETPPTARAIRPLEDACFPAGRAALIVEGFNEVMLTQTNTLWAIAVPVVIRYENDLAEGEEISERRLRPRRSQVVESA